ncbi:MAG: hypothetical protein Q9N02_10325 [Ghiorsea sp.]|nr:hypothetical protein [Ghiorsea sp.]
MSLTVKFLHELGALASVYPTEKKLPEISSNKISVEEAISQDWQKIGSDLQTAISRFKHEQQNSH